MMFYNSDEDEGVNKEIVYSIENTDAGEDGDEDEPLFMIGKKTGMTSLKLQQSYLCNIVAIGRCRQVAQIRYRYPATATDFATYATSARFGESYSQIRLPP